MRIFFLLLLMALTLFSMTSCTTKIVARPSTPKLTYRYRAVWIPGHYTITGRWVAGHWRVMP